MEFLIKISKENSLFSICEIENLFKTKSKKINEDYVLVDINKNLTKYFNRLALSKKILKILFICNPDDLINKINKFNFNKFYKKNFSLRKQGKSKISEKEIAFHFFNNLNSKIKNVKVDLISPTTKFETIFIDNKVYMCLLDWQNKDDFNIRKAHNRPELHPTSLNPRIAKSCINLTGIVKGKLYDPFCGSGGILIEAGLMNLKPIGYDIDRIMINRSKINLEYFNIKNYELKLKNSLKLNKKMNYIVTDLPYGKNTKEKNIQELYDEFLNILSKNLLKKAVIISPDYIHFNKLNKTKLIVEKEFSLRVHKSMTRKIRLIKSI